MDQHSVLQPILFTSCSWQLKVVRLRRVFLFGLGADWARTDSGGHPGCTALMGGPCEPHSQSLLSTDNPNMIFDPTYQIDRMRQESQRERKGKTPKLEGSHRERASSHVSPLTYLRLSYLAKLIPMTWPDTCELDERKEPLLRNERPIEGRLPSSFSETRTVCVDLRLKLLLALLFSLSLSPSFPSSHRVIHHFCPKQTQKGGITEGVSCAFARRCSVSFRIPHFLISSWQQGCTQLLSFPWDFPAETLKMLLRWQPRFRDNSSMRETKELTNSDKSFRQKKIYFLPRTSPPPFPFCVLQ